MRMNCPFKMRSKCMHEVRQSISIRGYAYNDYLNMEKVRNRNRLILISTTGTKRTNALYINIIM